MKARVHIVKTGVDHLEVEVDNEAAAERVADAARRHGIQPVIGQHRGLENTTRHYVALHGPVASVMAVLKQDPQFEVVKEADIVPTGAV